VRVSIPPRPDGVERSIDEQAILSQSLDELDALIKEARRRARRRRLIFVAVAGVMVAFGVGLFFVFGGGGGAASHGRTGRSQPPGQALKTQQNGRANVARSIAEEYVAALDQLDPWSQGPIFAKNAVEVDMAEGIQWHGDYVIAHNWADAFSDSESNTGKPSRWHGSLLGAAPSSAAVGWVWSGWDNLYTHKPFKTSGVSILEIKNGEITRESLYYNELYYNEPGR
jgi:hypothetical protein